MIVIGLDSGMGNQMFQYALGFALSREKEQELYIDLSYFKLNARPYALNNFNISAREFIIHEMPNKNVIVRIIWKIYKLFKIGLPNTRFIKEKKTDQYQYRPEYFLKGNSMYINGFWQNFRYFDAYKNDLKREFELLPSRFTKQMEEIMNEVQSVESVSIHIRRGDYVICDGWLLDDGYYLSALNQFDKDDVVFYVFCEDKNVVDEIMKGTKYKVVTGLYDLDDIQEFWVMKSCKNHIISNSTYSWWAAYLNDSGKVIAPIFKWWNENFYPSEWIKQEVMT